MKSRGGEVRIGYANDKCANYILPLGLGFCMVLAIGLYLSSYKTVILLTSLIAFICTFQASLRLVACLAKKPKFETGPDPIQWPFYTAFIPLFQEAHMVEELMIALGKIDYPAERLEIFMICEEVDPFTVAMVEKYLRPPFELIIVPKGTPQTKPRALNYALKQSKGELITIFDAEDIPHPSQLKDAARAFLSHTNMGALQAPLNYRNSDDNWITRQFSLEYCALFHVWVPFLASANLPFPLGGTSNHVRRDAIAKGWDAYNVTEDADLSFRLAAHDWTFGYIDSPTEEEAVKTWRSWFYQRSRWMKGFMQTWCVHMRVPFIPKGKDGVKRFLILQLTIGLTLLNAFFHLPILIIMGWVILTQYLNTASIQIPAFFIGSIIVSYLAGTFIGIIGAIRAGKPELILSAFGMPLYWLALFFPTMHALYELGRRPFFWHKTHHSVRGRVNSQTNIDTLSNYDAFG